MATRVNQQVLGIESGAETVFSSVGLPLAPAAGGLAEAVAEGGQAQDTWGKANDSNVKVAQCWQCVQCLTAWFTAERASAAALGEDEGAGKDPTIDERRAGHARSTRNGSIQCEVRSMMMYTICLCHIAAASSQC